jgi:hypothetical protein
MKTEPELTRELCKGLVKLGCMIQARVGSKRQAPGWPDRWLCHTLWTGHVEFKGRDTAIEPLQLKIVRDLNAIRPDTAYIARFVDAGIMIHDGTALRGQCFNTPESFLMCCAMCACAYHPSSIERRADAWHKTAEILCERLAARGEAIPLVYGQEHAVVRGHL